MQDHKLRELLNLGEILGAQPEALRVARTGGSARDLIAAVERASRRTPDQMMGISLQDTDGYSLLNLVRAQCDGIPNAARLERDVSAHVMERTGTTPAGDFVPFSILARDFNAGTAGEAGNFIGADRLGGLAGDPLRQVFTLGRLGATMFSGLRATAAVPVFESDTEAAYLSEIGAATSVASTTRLVNLEPRRLSVVFVMSRQAAIQSTPELEGALRRQLAAAIDEAMQAGILAGDGTGENPTGILNDADVNIEVGGANGATLTYQHLVNMENAALAADHADGARGWVVNPATAKYLRTKPRAAGLPEIYGGDNRILGAPVQVSNVMPANLTKNSGTDLSGLIYSPDWRELLIGVYGGGLDLVTDRVTLAPMGQLRLIATLTFGFGLRHPSAFSVMKDAALA